jgi:hypothetical protein
MRLSIAFLSFLAALAHAAPQAIDYGPCDYNGNENCKEIMDNTACFLNPKGANEIFKCISGGRDGVRSPPKMPRCVPLGLAILTFSAGLCLLRLSRLHARRRGHLQV